MAGKSPEPLKEAELEYFCDESDEAHIVISLSIDAQSALREDPQSSCVNDITCAYDDIDDIEIPTLGDVHIDDLSEKSEQLCNSIIAYARENFDEEEQWLRSTFGTVDVECVHCPVGFGIGSFYPSMYKLNEGEKTFFCFESSHDKTNLTKSLVFTSHQAAHEFVLSDKFTGSGHFNEGCTSQKLFDYMQEHGRTFAYRE